MRKVLTYVYADVNADDLAAWVFHVDTDKPSERHRLSPTFVVPHGTTRSEIEGVDCRQAIW